MRAGASLMMKRGQKGAGILQCSLNLPLTLCCVSYSPVLRLQNEECSFLVTEPEGR